MSGHRQYLNILVLACILMCGTATALTRGELQNQIDGQPPKTAIEHLYALEDEVRNWPPGEQIDYYRLLSELQRVTPVGQQAKMNWLLALLLGAATVALIVLTRKKQEKRFSIAPAEPLTTLYDHSTIFGIGKSLFRWANGADRNLSTMVFELDELDRIKTHHGAAAADQMLQLAALNARSVLRSNDCIGRMGHEEFLVVLPSTDVNQALEVAERIQSRLEEHPLTLDECPVLVTLSFGIAEGQGSNDSFKAMAERAESARKVAQERGRNQVVVADFS